jgi:hypothetical protein
MRRILFILLCSTVFFGCKKEKAAATPQHDAKCNHTHPAVAVPVPVSKPHDSSLHDHAKPMVSGNAPAVRKTLYDLTGEQIARHVSSANAGNMNSAFILSRYYSHYGDKEKTTQWIAKTRELAAKQPPDDPVVGKVLASLNILERSSAIQTNRPPAEVKQTNDSVTGEAAKQALLAYGVDYKRAYSICLRYSRQGDQEKMAQWAAKTRELVAKYPPDNETQATLIKLANLEKSSAGQAGVSSGVNTGAEDQVNSPK